MDFKTYTLRAALAFLILAPVPSHAHPLKNLVDQLKRGPGNPRLPHEISKQLWHGDDTLSRSQAGALRSALIGGARGKIDTTLAGSRVSFQSKYDGTWKGIVTGKLQVNGQEHYEVLVEKPRKWSNRDVWSNSTELWRRFRVKPGQKTFMISPGVRGTVLESRPRTRLGTEFAQPMKVRISAAPPSRPVFEIWHIAKDKVRTFKRHGQRRQAVKRTSPRR